MCSAGQCGFLEGGGGAAAREEGTGAMDRSHSQVVKGLIGVESGSNLFSAQREDSRVFSEKETDMI